MSALFYIHHLGEQLGPWTKDQVVEKINSKEINITDYVFDDEHKEWVLICDSVHFSEYFKSLNNQYSNLIPGSKSNMDSSSAKSGSHQVSNNAQGDSPVHEFTDTQSLDQAWYILKNENKFGPYSYLELVKMLQTKQLMEYDFIFKDGMMGWKTVSEVEEFGSDKIKELKNSGTTEIGEVFFRRRYLRVEYGASVVIHNNKSVWKGRGLEISPGGAGFLLEKNKISESLAELTAESATDSAIDIAKKASNKKPSDSLKNKNIAITVGQNLFLHFKAGDGVPPFNAVCTVVSVTSVSDQHLKLGVKFTNISQNVQQSIKTMTESFKQKIAA